MPKNTKMTIRVSDDTKAKIKRLAEKFECTNTQIVRIGLIMLYRQTFPDEVASYATESEGR